MTGVSVAKHKGNRNESIQALRFVAAFLVVVAHSIDGAISLGSRPVILSIGHLENFGAIGVDIFFVISGFIISKSAFGQSQPPAGKFISKRLSRVVPVYFLVSLLWIPVIFINGSLGIRKILSTFTFWPVWKGSFMFPVIEIGWTLSFEMLFYGSVALVLATRSRYAGPFMIAIYAFFLVLYVATHSAIFAFVGNPIIIEFLFGMAIAALTQRNRPQAAGAALVTLTALWCVLLIIFGFGRASEAADTVSGAVAFDRLCYFGIPAACLVAGAAILEREWGKNPIVMLFSKLGDSSYSLYLTHKLVIAVGMYIIAQIGVKLPREFNDLSIISASVVMTFIGVLFYRYVENPLLRIFHARPRIMKHSDI